MTHYILFENSYIADIYNYLSESPEIHVMPEYPRGYVIREKDIIEIYRMNLLYNHSIPN